MCNCNNSPCSCDLPPQINCDPCLSTDYCKDKIDASCVYYNLNDAERISRISCFLGLPSNTPLSLIIEKLDEKLCTLEAVSDINIVSNDCVSFTKNISDSGVITFIPVIDYTCLINTIASSTLFCQKVEDCMITPPTCSPVSSIQKISSTANTLTVGWSTVTGADSYDVKLFTDFTFITQVGATQTINHPTNTATFTGLSANTSYYVQIRTSCTNGLFSSVTSTGPFYTEVDANPACPSITIDSVIVTTDDVTVSWTGGVGATSYNVYINGVLQAGMPTALTSFTRNNLPNGNYNVKVEALPCVGIPQSDTENFVINYNAPSITLNCGGLTQISGSFQQGLASNGTIRVPVTVTGSDIVNVTVSGTGISGSVNSLIVNTFTTYIDIPLTYNGSSPIGSRAITVNVVGAVIPLTSCNGNVNITCPTCNNPTVTINNITSNGFTVNVSPLAVGEDYDLIISGLEGPEIINTTGLTTSYDFTTGNPSTIYTVQVIKNCACGNQSSGVTQNTVTLDGYQATIQIFPEDDGLGNVIVTALVTSGNILDNIVFNYEIQRYSNTVCTATLGSEYNGNLVLPIGSLIESSASHGLTETAQSLKIITLLANSTAITTSPQDIIISGRTYQINGYLICNLL